MIKIKSVFKFHSWVFNFISLAFLVLLKFWFCEMSSALFSADEVKNGKKTLLPSKKEVEAKFFSRGVILLMIRETMLVDKCEVETTGVA